MDALNSWPVMIGLALVLVALIGVYFWQRNKRDED
jgi:LPXTG-motif cell wall-anchored protein